MVFARLDRADVDEIRLVQRWARIHRSSRQIEAERRDQNRRFASGALDIRQQRVAGTARIDDQRVGEAHSGLDAAAVVLRLTGLGIFRILDRDQIVDQTDEPRRAAGFQPGQDGRFLQMVMRYQQIDGRFGALPKGRASTGRR